MDSIFPSEQSILKHEIGDTAVALLKAGAETDKKDGDGHVALDLAPDAQVWLSILVNSAKS